MFEQKSFFNLPENSKEIFKGKRWSIHQWEQKQFDGSTTIYETIKRKDTVVVIPVLEDGSIVIEEEQQPHWEKSFLSIMAGGAEEGEDIFESAKRETEEEIGMVFSNYYLVDVSEIMHGVLWTCYTFVAKNFEKKIPQALDGGEKITPKIISKEELISFVKNRSFRFNPRFIEGFVLADKTEEFFKILKNPENYQIKI